MIATKVPLKITHGSDGELVETTVDSSSIGALPSLERLSMNDSTTGLGGASQVDEKSAEIGRRYLIEVSFATTDGTAEELEEAQSRASLSARAQHDSVAMLAELPAKQVPLSLLLNPARGADSVTRREQHLSTLNLIARAGMIPPSMYSWSSCAVFDSLIFF